MFHGSEAGATRSAPSGSSRPGPVEHPLPEADDISNSMTPNRFGAECWRSCEYRYPRHVLPRVSSDNQDENVATIKVRTRGRDATSARTMAVAGRRGKGVRGERDGGHASACSADPGGLPPPRRGERSEPGRGGGRRILRGIGVG